MEPMRRFFNMNMAVVDLSDGSLEVLPLDPGLIEEKMGGAAVNQSLHSRYAEASPLVLGTGPLTGSLAPASCLLVATFQGPDGGGLCHTPLLFRAGPELKFSGFDFVVVKGTCSRPGVLTIGDGTIRLTSAEGLRDLTAPEAEAELHRRDPAAHRFVIMTGHAAEQGSPYASVGMGLGGSLDKTGLARWMAARNLKALVLNSNGGLPFGEGHLALRKRMIDRLAFKKKRQGARFVLKWMSPDGNGKILPSRFLTKHLACYGCPFPCTSHIAPGNLRHPWTEDHGFVLHDHVGFDRLSRRFGRDALSVMNACVRLGLDPAAVASFYPENGQMDDPMKDLLQFEKEKAIAPGHSDGILPEGISEKHYRLFGGGLPPISVSGEGGGMTAWERCVAAAMVLGLCPVFGLLFPHVKIEETLRFYSPDDAGVASLQSILENVVESLLSQAG